MRSLALALLLCPAFAFASEQWTEVKSPHFTVITDAGEKRGRDVALRFEQMRQVFGTLVLHREVQTSRPVQILAFKNSKEIRQVSPLFKGKPVELAGFYQKAEARDYIALDLSTEGDYKWQTVFHEYGHLLLNSNTFEWPAWFDEGFAELFSTIDLSGKKALIGRAPESAVQMLSTNRLIPVAQLFAVRHDSATYNESGDHRQMFYAESWLIVHYLEDKQLVKPVLTSFAESHGHPDEQIFRKNVGMGFAEFDRALEAYARSNRLLGWYTPLPTGIEASAFATHPLSQNDALVAVAEMHAIQRDHREEAIRELQQVVAAEPENTRALSDLGYAYVLEHEYEKAESLLEKATAKGSDDAIVHCYYAMLLQQEFQKHVPTQEQLDRQHNELEQAIKLDPTLAQAYNLLALNARGRQDFASAVQASLHAVAIDRRNEYYALTLAGAYASAHQLHEAQTVIDQLRTSQNPQILMSLASLEGYITQLQSYEASGGKIELVKHPGANDPHEGDVVPAKLETAPSRTAVAPGTEPVGSVLSVEGTLVQVDCHSDGSETLYMRDGTRLLQLRLPATALADQAGAKQLCSVRNRPAKVQYSNSGVVQKLSVQR